MATRLQTRRIVAFYGYMVIEGSKDHTDSKETVRLQHPCDVVEPIMFKEYRLYLAFR